MRFLRKSSLFDERGFTLVSVVAAVAVLAVAVFLLGGLMVCSLQDQQGSENGFQAVFLAQEKVEELKSVPFNQVISEPETDVPGYPGFRQTVTVEDLNPYTKRVTVCVSYPVRGSGDKTGAQVLVFERTVDF